MVVSHHVCFGGRLTLFFIAKNILVFPLIVQRVFSFSSTAFSFHFSPWFLSKTCYFLEARCIYTSGLCWFSSLKVVSKRLIGVGKEKKFHAYSGTNGSLFRLWLRLLHVMLDVILIICLVVFAVAWLVSNDCDCLMWLWKNHALFLLYGSILLCILLWCFIWVDLAHAYTMFDFNQSPQASMIIWFLTCDATLCFG
jgi:hypothetical protein